MKILVRIALLCSLVVTQCAWADAGPFYVSYPGFCDVKKVYVNARNDVYGKETSCTKSLGTPLLGSLLPDGKAIVGTTVTGTLCLFTHAPNKTLTIACYAGGDVAYEDHANGYTVRQSLSERTAEPVRSMYNISTEMPDIEKIKDLPAIGF